MGRHLCDFLKLSDKAVENQLQLKEEKAVEFANLRSNAKIVMTCAINVV